MTWKANLRPASFRGVPFKVEAHEAGGGGRAVVVHKFPLRNKHTTEDMGKNVKEFSIDAYVVSSDYMTERNALMRALDADGSAELVHPYLGTLKVRCTDYTLREGKSEGGMARFTLSFVESGEDEFPSDTTDALAAADAAADDAKDDSVDGFEERFSIDGLPDFATLDASVTLTSAATQLASIAKNALGLDGVASGYVGNITAFVGELGSLMQKPASLAGQYHDLVSGVSGLFDEPRAALKSLFDLFDFGDDQTPVVVTTSNRQAQQDNRAAINSMVQQAAVIQAARIAPSADYETVDDAQSVRDTLTEKIEVLMQDPATSDELFLSLQDVRTAVVNGVPPEDVALPRMVTFTPPVVVPSLVLAYSLYEDASRDLEIVSLNQIIYPGFVSGSVPLKVVSNA